MNIGVRFAACVTVLGIVWLSIGRIQVGTAAPKIRKSRIVCSENAKSGAACAEEEFRKKGRPLMAPEVRGLAFGISSGPQKPTEVFVWMDNRTDENQSYWMACNLSFLRAFSIYDSTGKALLTNTEEDLRKSHPSVEESLENLEVCSCCTIESITPHTLQTVDHGDLLNSYSLAPGHYFLVPVAPNVPRTSALNDLKGQTIETRRKKAIELVIPAANPPK